MSILRNKVITIYNRKTSMRLAAAEWQIIDHICYAEKIKRKNLFEMIDQNRANELGFTASVRLFALQYLDSLAQRNSLGYAINPNHINLHNTLQALRH